MDGLKIVVIGAGIGGLSAGIALKQAGFDVEIYDRVKELRPVGAGISLWSNGVKVLNRLGLGAEMAKIGGQMNRMEYRTQTGELLNDIDLMPLIHDVGQRPYPVARRDLQHMLMQAFPGDVKLGHKCVGVEEDETGVTAFFENGHQARGDLLIAADGIRSILRTHVLGQEVEPQYGGYINWNGLVPADESLAPRDCWIIYVGEHKRVSMMPVAGDRFYFFFDVPLPKGTPANPDTYKAELKQHFQGWADPVQTLIERLDPYAVARPEIHDVGPIDRFVKGRVALLGDSAHATCPDLGQGGCQAMEDSLVLTNYLMTTNLGVEYALKRYEMERKARANAVVQKARQRAEQIHGKEPDVTQRWYSQLATESPTDVTGAITKVIMAGPLR
ncbi:FAD-dependent urate hydroxylase HpxO [Oculatella sp. LEGE 06141]|uniref:FAD-dependent urate hydroxylase HpxO n=1 Tax=Oculatella sp. LEGE 06141 TaxID=1828648 RepID=UPI001882CF6E|nr:FAD-dependent urate hydroxylase HpxO [Oculatella sp. LEGE 06141]MBE9181418.1 FAD-dependent urate hydroxylase HpxO [Oculatella sp. LEGE 06141]